MDMQRLEFDDGTFDIVAASVAASFVLCSVPDPFRGLGEVQGMCKPGRRVVLLEYALSTNRVLGWLMEVVNPVVVRMAGTNISRRTVHHVAVSGLMLEQVTNLVMGVFKLIEAREVRSACRIRLRMGVSRQC